MLKNVIITCANEKYGDFLVNHWLKSLKENVNLYNIDIVVIDYGLNEYRKDQLLKENVIVFPGTKKYHIVNQRFFDAEKFLNKNIYDQVLFIDGGDIIFQDDISHVLNKDKQTFRVAFLEMESLFFEWFIRDNFDQKTKKKVWKLLKNKPVINAGVIFAPYIKFIYLCRQINKLTKNKNVFGPDQIIVNYVLYKSGIKLLDNKYNFMPTHVFEGFILKDNIFYKQNGEKIAIVHNAGKSDYFRTIKNFGYGKGNNQLKFLTYYLRKAHFFSLGLYKKILKRL